MSLHVVDTIEEFETLQSSWDGVTREPLRSFCWNLAWWQNFGEDLELRLYTFQIEGKTVGVAPFFVDQWLGQRRLRFLGSGDTCTDYAQISCDESHREAFIEAIIADISENSISMVELEGVSGEANGLEIHPEIGSQFWKYQNELEPTWILQIPENWTDFLSGRKKSLRRKVKKAIKRLESGEVVVRSTKDDLEFETAFNKLVELHQDRFTKKGEPGVFSCERFTNFLRSAAKSLCDSDRAEIMIGYNDDLAFVAQFYLYGANGPQLYQAGVLTEAMKLEPGHLMFTHAVKKAIDDGCTWFDFLRGSEPYKVYWGAEPHPLYKIRCVSNRIVPTTVNKAFCLLRDMKRTVNSLVPRKPHGAK
jgi:CelD/BcsL family acetyltransferase involved in cellulose biosynthesis